ncbi:copper oxidase [Paenibacillus rhizosphaerae]|uniref:Copper oxidase n=1 Tax=Paenibacillus rhizosphaerae TaxID=297318 RepID=A0A1R1F2J5_9BACL|nr:multicopper oxidase domain-containing protein [Paenibacillus rhizosphaerae]OMF58232.1 copper oxidase [Paenibacillus rhizosphaerae]
MFETITSMMLTYAVTALWLIVGTAAAGLPYVKGIFQRKVWRTLLLWISYIGLALALLWFILIISQWVRNGWWFVEGIVKTILPIMLIGYVPLVLYTLPLLRRLRVSTADVSSSDSMVTTTDPRLLIPIYAAALASGIAAFHTIFSQPTLPGLLEAVLLIALYLFVLVVPSFIVIRRYHAIMKGTFTVAPLWKRLLKFALAGLTTAIVAIGVVAFQAWSDFHASKLPEASDMMNHHWLDEGGGTPTMMTGHQHHADHANMVEVAKLTGDISAPADIHYELVAQKREITLASGAKIEAWTYNGEVAPELRARQGEMVEVKLMNRDIDKGVTIHWHGYNVPNAMDGVPGMTQNVVNPGESFTYKFRAEQAGTYWFHSHQQAAEQVRNGLFGSFIVEPSEETASYDEEVTLINHNWNTDQGEKTAFKDQDRVQKMQVKPGKIVLLRLINANNQSQKYFLQGSEYKITSIDGTPIRQPDRLSDQTAFRLAAGGRYDVTFTMPNHPVLLKLGDSTDLEGPSVVFYGNLPPDPKSFKAESSLFDPSQYGKPADSELTSVTRFDREFRMVLGNRLGFYNGKMNYLWTINGEVYPHTPTLVVKEGEKIKTTFINKSLSEHPMHLHGHQMTVLKKNGKRIQTPWVTDTLNVNPDEMYEVAFIADNPGMWMDHCHILDHAAVGMTLHLMYDHVMPSFEAGVRSGNMPE